MRSTLRVAVCVDPGGGNGNGRGAEEAVVGGGEEEPAEGADEATAAALRSPEDVATLSGRALPRQPELTAAKATRSDAEPNVRGEDRPRSRMIRVRTYQAPDTPGEWLARTERLRAPIALLTADAVRQGAVVAPPTVKQRDDIFLRNCPLLATELGLETDAWLAVVRQRMPEPSCFDFGTRRDWRNAFAAVAKVPVTRAQIEAVFVPVWICEQQEESTNGQWDASLLLVWADGRHQLMRERFDDDAAIAVRIEHAHRGYLAPARSYASDIPILHRNGSDVALASHNPERVLSITGAATSTGVPRPTEELPPWTSGALPAIDLSALDELWERFGKPAAGEAYRGEGSRWRTAASASRT